VVAPAGTPEPIVRLLNTTINDALATAEIRDTITKLGSVPSPVSPEEFAQFIGAQVRKWSAVAKAANVTIN
jgi:tripartite-type tricarboxylate transporter receptor subunit TctC